MKKEMAEEKGNGIMEPMELAKNQSSLEKLVDRKSILSFEAALAQQKGAVFGDTDSCPLKHSFAPGVYVREIFIPKGTMLTGKIHRHSHPNILLKGEVIVATEFGGREHLKAPLSMISKAGTKRAVFALEDTVWITIHATHETDLEKIEDYVIAPSYEAYEEEQKQIVMAGLEEKNCLILALKKLGRDYKCLLELTPEGTNLPFKKAIEVLKENKISFEEIRATEQKDGVWHVEVGEGIYLDAIALDDSDLVGAWVAVAVGGAAVVGGAASYLRSQAQAGAASDASAAQLQAAREAIAAQKEGANKAYKVFEREAANSRSFLEKQAKLARAELAPLREMGLRNLKQVEAYTDPNSKLSQQERTQFSRVLQNNLSARGLTGSGTEIAGLSDFELGLARQRRDLSLGLAGIGANTLQQTSALESGLGQGLAGISQNLGSVGSNIYSNLGIGIAGILQNSGIQQGNLALAQGQYAAQGLAGVNNALQTGLSGILSYNQYQNQQARSDAQFNALLPLLKRG